MAYSHLFENTNTWESFRAIILIKLLDKIYQFVSKKLINIKLADNVINKIFYKL